MADRKTCMTLSLGDETIEMLKEMAEMNGRSYTAEMTIMIRQAYKDSHQVDMARITDDNRVSGEVPF